MKRKRSPRVFVVLLILLILVAGVITYIVQRTLPTKERANLTEYFGPQVEGEAYLAVGSSLLEEKALVQGDLVYLPLSVVNTYLNQRFYWDSTQVLYATPTELTAQPASGEPGGSVWVTGDTVYLSLPYVQAYTDLDVVMSQEPSHIGIWAEFEDVTVVTAGRQTAVRTLGGIKAPILTEVAPGEDLLFLEEFENWYKVATRDGFTGFVQKKYVSAPQAKTYDRAFSREEYTYLTMEEKVNLVWHQVTVPEANAYFESDTAAMTGVNVISPTWYYLNDNSGNVVDISSADYVAKAHARGLQVWGLVDNFTNNSVSTYEILSNTGARQNLIGQLVASAVAVGMDGINIDFEYLSEESGVHFLEFLRELSIACHKNNLVLSVDNPVPEDFTSHYDRREQGQVVDYVIIMGYDEHYAGSDAGAVASLPWVEQGIIDTLSEVPAQRVINGVPFYNRIWKTQAGTLSSDAVSMGAAQAFLAENHVETYWDTELSQNVGTVTLEDGTFYQIWVEDGQSIAAKMELISKYSLAGVAAWKLGLEDNSIWQVISEGLR